MRDDGVGFWVSVHVRIGVAYCVSQSVQCHGDELLLQQSEE
jgi:hypothetical protein